MHVILRAYGPLYMPPHQHVTGYVKSYHPDATDGTEYGDLEFTQNPRDALRFTDAVAVLEFLNQTPKAHPVRYDGQPNRPIMAFDIELIPVYDQ